MKSTLSRFQAFEIKATDKIVGGDENQTEMIDEVCAGFWTGETACHIINDIGEAVLFVLTPSKW